jgi:toxin ParE1/3/4
MAYRLSPQADSDLEDIAFYVYLESGSVEIAERVTQSIAERFDLLDAYPQAGRPRDDLRPGIRGFPVGDYVVLYRVEGADVAIVRVARGSRDLEALLGE